MNFKNLDEVFEFYNSHDKINNLMPIEFETGIVVDDLDFKCPFCKSNLSKDTRGKAIAVLNNKVVQLNAVAPCHPCKMFIPFNLRIRSDDGNTISTEFIDSNGKWIRRDFSSKSSSVAKLINFLHSITFNLFRIK